MRSQDFDTIPVHTVEWAAGSTRYDHSARGCEFQRVLERCVTRGTRPVRRSGRAAPDPADSSRGLTPLTYHYWHAFVPELTIGQIYGFRAHGPDAPERGLLFDAEKVLLDPYGRAVAVPEAYDREAATRPGDNAAVAMKSVVADRAATTGRRSAAPPALR